MSAQRVSSSEVRPRLTQLIPDFSALLESSPHERLASLAMRLQPRASAALDVVTSSPMHLFVAGGAHLLKHELVLAYLEGAAKQQPRASDWAYVYNEAEPSRPWPLRLPPGRGHAFAQGVEEALGRFQKELARVLGGANYRRRVGAVEAEAQKTERHVLEALKTQLKARQFVVNRSDGRLEAVPLWRGKKVTKPLEALPAAAKKSIEARLPELSDVVEQCNHQLVEQRAAFEATYARMRRETALEAAQKAFASLEHDFASCRDAVTHVSRLKAMAVEHHGAFLDEEGESSARSEQRGRLRRRFEVQVLVSQTGLSGAPVCYEETATAQGLFGSVWVDSSVDSFGVSSGVFHRANGGFLVLSARAILSEPESWAAIKRALKTKHIRCESWPDLSEGRPMVPLRPHPIPLECSVVLLGELDVYEALYEQDAEFRELFSVRADFAESVGLMHRSWRTLRAPCCNWLNKKAYCL